MVDLKKIWKDYWEYIVGYWGYIVGIPIALLVITLLFGFPTIEKNSRCDLRENSTIISSLTEEARAYFNVSKEQPHTIYVDGLGTEMVVTFGLDGEPIAVECEFRGYIEEKNIIRDFRIKREIEIWQ